MNAPRAPPDQESPKRCEEILKKLRSSRGTDKFEEWEIDFCEVLAPCRAPARSASPSMFWLRAVPCA